MPSRKIEDLDIRLQSAWKKAVAQWNNKNGLVPFLTCTARSPQEQALEYAKGRTIANGVTNPHNPLGQVVTNAKPYQSPHNFTPAQAFDFAFEINQGGHWVAVWKGDCYKEFISLLLAQDNTLISGSTFKGLVDTDHFETPDWKQKFAHLIPA